MAALARPRAGARRGAEEIFWAVRRLLEALAARQPLVVVFDDIHWAEPTLLDLVEHVADWSRATRRSLLLCLAGRSCSTRARTGAAASRTHDARSLEPLADEREPRS